MTFLLLILSKHQVRLFSVRGEEVQALSPTDLPASMKDAWEGMERHEQSLQFHSGAGGGGHAVFHGQGGAKDVESQEEEHFLHRVYKAIRPLMHDEQLPLVFAGVEHAYGLLRTFDDTGLLVEEYVHGNHDDVPAEEIIEKAMPLARNFVLQKNAVLAEEFGNHLQSGLATTDVSHILERAAAGKVEMLLLSADDALMGTYNAQTHDFAEDASVEDAVDAKQIAEEHTRAHRGRVAWLASEDMPSGSAMAAILRQ